MAPAVEYIWPFLRDRNKWGLLQSTEGTAYLQNQSPATIKPPERSGLEHKSYWKLRVLRPNFPWIRWLPDDLRFLFLHNSRVCSRHSLKNNHSQYQYFEACIYLISYCLDRFGFELKRKLLWEGVITIAFRASENISCQPFFFFCFKPITTY